MLPVPAVSSAESILYLVLPEEISATMVEYNNNWDDNERKWILFAVLITIIDTFVGARNVANCHTPIFHNSSTI